MVHDLRLRLLAAALAVSMGLVVPECPGQGLPAAPVPVGGGDVPAAPNTPAPAYPPRLPYLPPQPLNVGPYQPPACAPYEDCNGPLLVGDPLQDRPGWPLPGWFGTVEAGILAPHFKNALVADVALGDFVDRVHLPGAKLDWVGAPRVQLGYRFPEGCGELLLSYHSIVSEGTTDLPGFDLDGSDGLLKSRLNVNVVDLDYASREFSLGPCWDMKWLVGLRFGAAYYDATAVGVFLEDRTSNDFRGVGPHVGVQLQRSIPQMPGLGFYSKLEGAALVGQVRQAFEETFDLGDGTNFGGGATNQHQTQAVPVIDYEVGLSWFPPYYGNNLRMVFGYQFEGWWYLGTAGDSRATLTLQGAFFRAEIGF